MTAHPAVCVSDDLASGQPGVGKRRTDYEASGGIHQTNEVGVEVVVQCGQLHDGLHQRADVLDRAGSIMLGADEKGGDAFGIVIIRNLRFGVREQPGRAAVPEKPEGVSGDRIGNGKHLRGLVSGVAKHHALIACAVVAVNAKGNVRTLAADVDVEPITADVRETDAGQDFRNNLVAVWLVAGGEFACNGNVVVLNEALHSHTAVAVIAKAVGEDGI